ncbi:ribulose-phosphate 3-epimerase [Tundrisphaera sp. TA3]|uniref:ribulose-phosphate 3-epimerase n=1 Tax=Tundrisphaera sp. TA3 TaxID=3435775 RepID=UPI003EB770D2
MGDDPKSPAPRQSRLAAWDALPRPFVTPSMLSCDFSRPGEELDALRDAGVAAVHLDVMDGHFVPNLTFGAPVIADWRKRTDFTFDVHLMMTDPGRYLDDFVKAGSDIIIVQIEAVPEPSELLRRIREAGCRASLALNPPTPLSAIEPFLDELDAVLVMSVMPGFGGQKFDPSVLGKVRALRAARPDLWISIDGGIKPDTAVEAVAAGVSQMVAGSGVFRSDGNYAAALAELAEGIRLGSERGRAPSPPAGPRSHE